MVSLNEDISLDEYNFIEWTDKFLETQAAQAYSLYIVWELRERAIYTTLYGNLPDISKW